MSSQPSKPPAIPRTLSLQGVGRTRFAIKNLEDHWYSDVYHYLLAITWRRLLCVFFLVYVSTNALFGLLYWVGGNDIANARPGSYADAFWFSVETYATVGYGGMAPTTTYAHLLVTVEAFVGMMAAALATGIVFAKFSRPTARIAFSDKIVVHVRNGRPVLEFRLANQRRGSLSDAHMKLSALRDEVTAEGQPMRRTYPLELERPQMPVLSLAWNLSHVLDERSPLHGLCPADTLERVIGFIAIMTAHDDTSGETVHARQFYAAEDVHHNMRFIDMIDSKSEPGVIAIDHALLHEIGPIPAGVGSLPPPVASDADSEAGGSPRLTASSLAISSLAPPILSASAGLMKLFRFGAVGEERPGLIVDGVGRVDVSAFGEDYGEAFFGSAGPARVARFYAENPGRCPHVAADARIAPAIARPSKIVCVGLNYRDHALETGAKIPDEPVLFMKATSAICGPNDDVVLPRGSVKTDWEVELGVVIGKVARYVEEPRWREHVAGFVLMNDYSEREFQRERGGQFTKGKSADTFAPIGPFLVTSDALDASDLRLWLNVNGEPCQNSRTSELIFSVPKLIAYISSFMTLLPGDVISTGTPAGVGLGRKPPSFLKQGDVVEFGIEGLGEARQLVSASA